jgi:hypothetical protein
VRQERLERSAAAGGPVKLHSPEGSSHLRTLCAVLPGAKPQAGWFLGGRYVAWKRARRVFGIYGVLSVFNAAAWLWAVVAFRRFPVLLGTAFLAYSFGLRHAVDAGPGELERISRVLRLTFETLTISPTSHTGSGNIANSRYLADAAYRNSAYRNRNRSSIRNFVTRNITGSKLQVCCGTKRLPSSGAKSGASMY